MKQSQAKALLGLCLLVILPTSLATEVEKKADSNPSYATCPWADYGELHFGNQILQDLGCYSVIPAGEEEDDDEDDVATLVSRWRLPKLSRFEDASFAFHSLRIVARASPARGLLFSSKTTPVKFCLHRNASAPLTVCQGKWKELNKKGLWAAQRSPFESTFLDIQWPTQHGAHELTVSVIAEAEQHRVGFFALGLLLMPLASTLSQIVVLYYGVGMSVGVLLVLGLILFQVMKLLPLTRGSSMKVVFFGAVMGMGGIFLTWLNGLASEAAEYFGFGDQFVNPLVWVALALTCLAGAAMGFWFVRKLVILPSGELDPATVAFVRWALIILAASLLIASSSDAVFGALALLLGVSVTLLTSNLGSIARALWKQRGPLRVATPKRVDAALEDSDIPAAARRPALESEPLLQQAFVSAYHHVDGRRPMTPKDVKTVSRTATDAALKDLMKSPAFGAWALRNIDRIQIVPDASMRREGAERDRHEIAFTGVMEEGPLPCNE